MKQIRHLTLLVIAILLISSASIVSLLFGENDIAHTTGFMANSSNSTILQIDKKLLIITAQENTFSLNISVHDYHPVRKELFVLSLFQLA